MKLSFSVTHVQWTAAGEGHQAKGLKMFVIIIHVFSQAYENFHYCIQEVTGVKFGQLTNNTAVFN